MSTSGPSRPPKWKPTKSRNLDALAIAQQEEPTKIRVRPNRLGDIEDDSQGKSRTALGDQNQSARPTKRRKLQGGESSASEDDDQESDTDGEEWHVGVDGEDNDSDLDSDEAMGDSDEERFEGFAFRGSSAPSSKKLLATKNATVLNNSRDIDSEEASNADNSFRSENYSENEDGLGEGAVDLATAFDMAEDGEREKKQARSNHSKSLPDKNLDVQNMDYDGASSDDEVSASEDAQSNLSYSEDDDSVSNHNRLKNFVQSLEANVSSKVPGKRSKARVTPGEPSDYGLASSQKLTIADLLPTVRDPRLRESLKMLHDSEQKGSNAKSISGKLEPPLPKRQQDRLDREAAYEKSKETLSRWIDTVKRNRRAEHIAFPLTDPDALAALGTNQLMPIDQSDAVTPLEAAIRDIMTESGLASKDRASGEEAEKAFEELQEKKLPIEEVQVRRAELRKVRELMFREEIRARRIKKIKSKAYRRVHRKERDRHAQEERAALAAAGALNSDDERERQDRRRAEERMGARHKESRWAKAVKQSGRAAWDEDARVGVNDLARKDEELRKRIEGKEPNQSGDSVLATSDEESSDDVSVDEYNEIEEKRLKEKLEGLEAMPANPSGSRLSSMPFMRKAESARQAANQADIDETRRLLAGENKEAENEDTSLAQSGGRRRFGTGKQVQHEGSSRVGDKNEFEERLSEDEAEYLSLSAEHTLKAATDVPSSKVANRRLTTRQSGDNRPKDDSNNTENPWLSGPSKRKAGLVTDETIISTKAIPQDHIASTSHSEPRGSTSKTKDISQSMMQRLTSPSDSENETPAGHPGHGQSSRRNEELVRMAFAGDDVFEVFADEKKATIEEEGDQVVDNSLPGWGSWAGAGISKKEQRRANSRKTASIVKGVDPKDRKDAKLERVIINEKRSKKVSSRCFPVWKCDLVS